MAYQQMISRKEFLYMCVPFKSYAADAEMRAVISELYGRISNAQLISDR